MRTIPTVFACLLASACSDPAPPPATPDLPEVRQLCERLDRLLAVLESTRAGPQLSSEGSAPGAARTPTAERFRTPADEEPSVLKLRIDELEAELSRTRTAAANPAANPAAVSVRSEAVEPMRTDIVRDFIVRYRDETAVQRNDLLRTMLLKAPSQIAAEFGMPTASYVTKNGSLLFEYSVGDDVTTMVFADGQLVTIW